MINKKNLFVSPLLTNVSLAYSNEAYIAEKVFPIVKVKKPTGQIVTYAMDNLRIDESARSQGSRTNEVGHTVTIGAHYEILEHAHKELVTDEEVEDADNPIKPKTDATQNITEKLLVEKEYDISTFLNSSSNLTKYTTLTSATRWSTPSTSDPITNMRTGRRSVKTYSGKRANILVIAENSYEYLLEHPDIIDRIKYSRVATQQEIANRIAQIFGLDKSLIGEAQYNSGGEGASESLTDIWSHFAVVAYIAAKPKKKSRTLGHTYTHKAPRVVDSWRGSEGTDRKGWFYRVTDHWDQKAVDVNCAYLFLTATA